MDTLEELKLSRNKILVEILFNPFIFNKLMHQIIKNMQTLKCDKKIVFKNKMTCNNRKYY